MGLGRAGQASSLPASSGSHLVVSGIRTARKERPSEASCPQDLQTWALSLDLPQELRSHWL